MSSQSRHRLLLITTLLSFGAVPAHAGSELAVGTVVEPSFLWALLRLTIGFLGILLLTIGPRKPRLVLGSLVLIAGGLVAHMVIAPISLLLAAAAVSLSCVVALEIEARWPRVAWGLAAIWPLPAMYIAWLLHTGSFDRNLPLVIASAVLGIVIGAVRTNAGTTLVTAALGAVLLAAVLPLADGPVSCLVAFVAAITVHIPLWMMLRHSSPAHESAPARTRVIRSFAWSAGVLMGALVLVAVAAPHAETSNGDEQRLVDLSADGEFERPALLVGADNNFYLSGRSSKMMLVSDGNELWSRLTLPFLGRSLDPVVAERRAVKSSSELATLQTAATITSQTFVDIAPMIAPGVSEAVIAQAIRDSFARQGATGMAFESIVGSGANATLPHYMRNDTVMHEGFVVIDIGCSVDGYASDMTRTFPVTGELSPAQQRLLEVTSEAHEAALALCRPGGKMKELTTVAKELIDEAGFVGLMTHGIGHHVGINVHDPHVNELETGMVVTIEPGIYVPEGADVDPSYWNLGSRIEDTYLVTDDGCEALTAFPWNTVLDVPTAPPTTTAP